MSCGHDFNFIGDIISLTATPSCGEELISIRVKLINDPDQPDFFNLPLLANRKNLRSPVMQAGDKVSGCFWLQGRLAD